MRRILLAMLPALHVACAALAADVAGGKDPAFLKRFEGSEIVRTVGRTYDEYKFLVGEKLEPAKMEGQVTRIFYRVPAGHTALELLRNYESEVKGAGLEITGELLPCKVDYVMQAHTVFQQNGLESVNNIYVEPHSSGDDPDGPSCYFSARGLHDGQDVGVAAWVVEKHRNLKGWPPLAIQDGEIIVGLDVVTAKAVEIKMVQVKASDMADALATKGTIDLYGILFDVDKTDIKPESAKTLDEVASLLRIDRTLKLQIAGHTDNSGDAAHNQKLSEGRAAAVVQVLTSKYAIDPSRLQAVGYGDTKPIAPNDTDANKAKNRRVELTKL